MVVTIALLLAAPATPLAPACREVRQACRACPTSRYERCSTVGIACQPVRRVCSKPIPSPVALARAGNRMGRP
jgi:hypothetical protein